MLLVFGGSAGALITAIVNAVLKWRSAPVEVQATEANTARALSRAAQGLVASQALVVAERDAEIKALDNRVAALEAQIQVLLKEVAEERQLRQEREHELTQHRMILAEQQTTIDQQAAQLRSQSARISALKRATKALGHDPDLVAPNEIEEDKDAQST